jgi:hypothetical protein
VCEKVREYLGTETSYRQAADHQGKPILYEERQASRIAVEKEPVGALAPSTVWRWLSWLGSLENTMRGAGQLIRGKAPGSTLHREPWPLSARMYRSEARRQTLQRAAQCLVIEPLFRELFQREIFPHFATAHGWS